MTLNEFLVAEGRGSKAAIARRLGCTKAHISYLCNGRRKPGLCLALQIQRLTSGAVPVSSWVKDWEANRPAHKCDES